MLVINEDVVVLQVFDGFGDDDVFFNLTADGGKRHWPVVFRG